MRKSVLYALFLLFVPATAPSQFFSSPVKFYENGQPTRTGEDAAMFPDTPSRMKIDLAGEWHYSLDGKTWTRVSVPSVYDFTARVTFQRTFDIQPAILDQYTFSLVAYGINHQCEISVNGNFIGRHTNGYASFILPIPAGALQVGNENSIQIVVDNELTPKTTMPLRLQVGGWRTYGGIFRDIYLLATPKLFVENVNYSATGSPDWKQGKIQVSADVTDRASDLKTDAGSLIGFQTVLYDKLSGALAGRSAISPLVIQAGKSVAVSSQLEVLAPKLWSPEAPDLYVLRCQIIRTAGKDKEVTVVDEYAANVGFRDVHWKEGKLMVNGAPLVLRGVLWQEENSTFASAMTYEGIERDVASMKALGANLIRFLYPPHPYMINLCDRYGLFVMEEIPVVDVPLEILSKDYYQDLATSYAKEMVERDRNHTSILAWGIGSEFETRSASAGDYVNGMRNAIRSLDSRAVYFATNWTRDACYDYVDMIALDTYTPDLKEFRELLRQCKVNYPEKPIIVARYGRDVEPGNRNGYSDPLSMESQARQIMQFFGVVQDAKVAGSVLWSFNDWRMDRASLTTHSHDPYLSSMGLVSSDRQKRVAYDVARALFNGEKVQALPVGNYSSSTPVVYVVVGFLALIAFAFIYNANRRFRDCVNRSLFRTYNFFADVRDQHILTYGHSLFLAVIVSITWATVLSSIFSHYRDSLLLDNLLSQFLPDGLKESFIRLVWSPPRFILVVAGLVLLKLLVLSVLVKAFSFMVRARVYFYHSFSITMWSMLPCIVLIPVAMILFRLMETEFYLIPVFVLLGLVIVWVLARLLKGISIIYDVFPVKVYAMGLLLLVVMAAALYGYLDYTKSTTLYLKYMLQTMGGSA